MNVIEQQAPVSRAPRETPNRRRIRERFIVVGVALLAALVVIALSGIAAGGETKTTTRPRVWPATAAERRIQAEAIAARDAELNRYWTSIQVWVNGVVANQQRELQAARARTLAAQTASHRSSVRSSGGCGGLEACRACVTSRESATAGLYNAYNPSGAAGRYQVMPNTWGGFGGYASAKDAPPEVQDEWFNQAYSRFHGQAEWNQLYTDGC